MKIYLFDKRTWGAEDAKPVGTAELPAGCTWQDVGTLVRAVASGGHVYLYEDGQKGFGVDPIGPRFYMLEPISVVMVPVVVPPTMPPAAAAP